MKAKLLGDTICPDFLYTIVEINGDTITLGWNGRRGFWNEITRNIDEVLLVEEEKEE